MKRIMILILTGMMIFLASCSRETTPPSPPLIYEDVSSQTRFTVLNFPSASFSNVIWWSDGKIIAFQNSRPREQFGYAVEGDDKLRYFDLGQDNTCVAVFYSHPTRLPDGRLGLIKLCSRELTFDNASYMVAYDWQTGKVEQIVQTPLQNFATSGWFSWNPDMTRGIQVDTSGIGASLAWITPLGAEPVNIILRDGDRTWDLSKGFYEDNHNFDEDGLIDCPTWSPLGDQIAVFISFDAMGMTGIKRLDQQFQLILLSPKTGETESVLSGIYFPEYLDWSPDGKSIAFVSSLDEDNQAIFVFDVKTRSLILIAKGKVFSFQDLSWSPDSQNIAVLWCDGIDCEHSEIRKYSYPTIK